jgi:hypothetical protein
MDLGDCCHHIHNTRTIKDINKLPEFKEVQYMFAMLVAY